MVEIRVRSLWRCNHAVGNEQPRMRDYHLREARFQHYGMGHRGLLFYFPSGHHFTPRIVLRDPVEPKNCAAK